jgi:hypothetical protein
MDEGFFSLLVVLFGSVKEREREREMTKGMIESRK